VSTHLSSLLLHILCRRRSFFLLQTLGRRRRLRLRLWLRQWQNCLLRGLFRRLQSLMLQRQPSKIDKLFDGVGDNLGSRLYLVEV
jgi:hypothetical protein